jgi:hypothetical protein
MTTHLSPVKAHLRAACCFLLACSCSPFLASCSSEPPKPKSAEELSNEQWQKDQEHRVFYEGWLHPN